MNSFVPRLPLLLVAAIAVRAVPVPAEPIEIGTVPQFFIDDHLVDNRWALNYDNGSTQMVTRVLHPPKKYARNPVFTPKGRDGLPDSQPNAGWCNVLRDPETARFRMWYQETLPKTTDENAGYAV